MTRTLLAVASFWTLAACGISAPDVAAYQQSVSELQAAVVTHEADAVATLTTDECLAEHQRYDALARPRMGQMTMMSGGMDSCGGMMGRSMGMRTMCGSMQGELDRHASAACSGDAAANHAEATHHCQLMRDWLGQQQAGATSCAR